jgi:hypothetical protein
MYFLENVNAKIFVFRNIIKFKYLFLLLILFIQSSSFQKQSVNLFVGFMKGFN